MGRGGWWSRAQGHPPPTCSAEMGLERLENLAWMVNAGRERERHPTAMAALFQKKKLKIRVVL